MTTEETAMVTTLKNAQRQAAVAAKEERARDAALAMQEYEAERLNSEVKTARLRALRLAKEVEERTHTKAKARRTKMRHRDRAAGAAQPSICISGMQHGGRSSVRELQAVSVWPTRTSKTFIAV
jgi:hypothetical protein